MWLKNMIIKCSVKPVNKWRSKTNTTNSDHDDRHRGRVVRQCEPSLIFAFLSIEGRVHSCNKNCIFLTLTQIAIRRHSFKTTHS
uniref:Ovule protein n=1 Tax=Panagrellus redivivus TaxID=6233 RepID=A0A7E4ZV80_PANRE